MGARSSTPPRPRARTASPGVFAKDLRSGRTELVARTDGRRGAPADADAFEPTISYDGRVVAFVSRARNLAGDPGGRSAVYVRDLRAGPHDARQRPALRSRCRLAHDLRDGRFVVFLAREGRPDGTMTGLRSTLWLHDRRSGRTTLVSRGNGRAGVVADGFNSEPAVSADGRRIAFTSTAGNIAPSKPFGLPGVFVRDLARRDDRVALDPPASPGSGRPRRDHDRPDPCVGEQAPFAARGSPGSLLMVGAGGAAAVWLRRRRWAG